MFQDDHAKGDDEDSDADLCLDENVPYGDRSNGYPGISTVNGICLILTKIKNAHSFLCVVYMYYVFILVFFFLKLLVVILKHVFLIINHL